MIASVDAVPVALVVTTVAHAPEAMAEVPRAEVPLAIVVVQVVQVILPVAVVMANGEDAVTAGVPEEVPRVMVGVPAAACTVMFAVPEVDPLRATLPEAEEPTLDSVPLDATFQPNPFTSACHGVAAEPEAVVNLPRIPVPVFEAVSVKVNILLVEVAAPAVKVEMLALPIDNESAVEGLVSDDHELEPEEMVLQPKPVPEVHVRALVPAEQEGMASAVGTAVLPVPLPTIVFAACVANPLRARALESEAALPVVFWFRVGTFAALIVPVSSSFSLPLVGFEGVIVKPVALTVEVMKFSVA